MRQSPFARYQNERLACVVRWTREEVADLRRWSVESRAAGDLSCPLVGALRSHGLFRLAQPTSVGGWELDPIAQIGIVEVLSSIDAAIGWAVCIGADTGFYASRLRDPTALTRDIDAITAGYNTPSGSAARSSGGYILNGRWPTATMIAHADVAVAGFSDPASGAELVAVLAQTQFMAQRDWQSFGMQGTGTHSYDIHDEFVPDQLVFDFESPTTIAGPLYSHPRMYRLNLAGVPIGLSRATLSHARDALKDIRATDRRDAETLITWFENSQRDAEQRLFDAVSLLWHELSEQGKISLAARLSLNDTFAAVFTICGRLHRALLDNAAFVIGALAEDFGCRISDAITVGHHAVVRRAQNNDHRKVSDLVL